MGCMLRYVHTTAFGSICISYFNFPSSENGIMVYYTITNILCSVRFSGLVFKPVLTMDCIVLSFEQLLPNTLTNLCTNVQNMIYFSCINSLFCIV